MFSARAAVRLVAGMLILIAANDSLQTALAEGDTRTLSFHHSHTGESITITYKRDGRYDEAALEKLNWFMRDWRRSKETKMDPHLFDLLWETYREVGGKQPIEIICGYRSPETNAMLRARSSGVAQFSQHINGQAIDFNIPGVPLEEIRAVGLRLQRGGVGFYPTSGSPFVHMDTGRIRHWPRMTHDQLVKVFPNGRTVHIPSDGRPLPGYALALADVQRRGSEPSDLSIEAARDSGITTASNEPKATGGKRGLLSNVFGARRDEDEESEKAASTDYDDPPVPAEIASAVPRAQVVTQRIIPLPLAKPKPVAIAALTAKPKQDESKPKPVENKVAAAVPPAGNIFDNRGLWKGGIDANPAPTPAAGVKKPFELASADPVTTASAGHDALAYAAGGGTPSATRVSPMGTNVPRAPSASLIAPGTSFAAPSEPNTTVLVKPPLAAASSRISGTLADPWLRATMLTPSVHGALTARQFGAADPRPLTNLLHKPEQLLVMTFSADPHLGMTDQKFDGHAVVFLATATFGAQTASLR